MTDFRALCQELHAAVQLYTGLDPAAADTTANERVTRLMSALDKTAAALAQPEPQGPTDAELITMWASTPYIDQPEGGLAYARAALARWGRPAVEPVPVSERLPGPEDCDAMRRCWWIEFDQQWFAAWTLDSVSPRRATHWLPHWALPVPGVEGADA